MNTNKQLEIVKNQLFSAKETIGELSAENQMLEEKLIRAEEVDLLC